MRPRRFDRQLQFVFMVLSGLTILVGITSFGVNRFLITSHERVLGESIAIIQRAERIGLDADLAGTTAGRLAEAGTEAEIAQASEALRAQVARIESDIGDLRHFLGDPSPALTEAEDIRALVATMASLVRRKNALAEAAAAERARLADAGSRLTQLISAETDLARLRITAGIWQMYAAPDGQSLRPMLDRLADTDFFAFERIRALAEATATLTRAVQQVADSMQAESLAALQARMEDALQLALTRTPYLPTAPATKAAEADLAIFRDALGDRGLIALKRDELAALAELSGLSVQLQDRLAVLTKEARAGQEGARALMKSRIADAGWQAAALNLALAGVIALGLLAGYLVWVRTRRHVVSRLGVVAERIVQLARGETAERMRISGHDEIGRLEKAVNVLRRRTEEAARLRESLEAAVLARTADVVAEMHSADAARAEAEGQSHAKTHFLARMSHEIRTPLNGVIGLLDLLVADEADPARRTRLGTALTSARDLQELAEDILSFSSGEETQAQARLAAFDPARLAQGLADHLRVLARPKGLATVIEIPDDLPAALLGDATRIRQVVVNLISNAVKYTDTGEVALRVALRSAPDAAWHEIAFAVTDTGPGMTAAETRQAFDIYGRTFDARRRGIAGVGLGLAIVRQLTDAMGGELRVASVPGKGSSFSLALRLAPADPAALASEAAPAVPPGLRVLVVEDHPVNRLVARGYLERMGCTMTEAATGAEALAHAISAQFDVILIDLNLPDMRGEEVAAKIDRKGARVAVLTADPVTDDAATRVRLGVDHALTKPVSPRALAAVLAGGPDASKAGENAATETVLREDVATLGPDLTAEIVAAFLTDLAEVVPVLLAAEDTGQRRTVAHRMKGAASNFALHDLCDLLKRIEAGDAAALPLIAAEADRAATGLRAAAARAGLQLPSGTAKQ